jgi:hypothetical protein
MLIAVGISGRFIFIFFTVDIAWLELPLRQPQISPVYSVH